MDNQTCPLHQVPMIEKQGNYGPYFSHMIQNVGFCNGKKITPFKDKPQSTSPETPTKTAPITREPIEEPKVDWDAKDRQSMAQTAMKCASEIIAALINAGISTTLDPAQDVKTMANDFFNELKLMKKDV